MTAQLSAKEIERFWSKVQRGDGCWLWTGEVNNKGYGRFATWCGDSRHRLLAHRLAYELTVGPLWKLKARHQCDNPPCCNPAHIEPGTQLDNIHDALRRGRHNRSGLDAYRKQRDEKAAAALAAGDPAVATRMAQLRALGLTMRAAHEVARGNERRLRVLLEALEACA